MSSVDNIVAIIKHNVEQFVKADGTIHNYLLDTFVTNYVKLCSLACSKAFTIIISDVPDGYGIRTIIIKRKSMMLYVEEGSCYEVRLSLDDKAIIPLAFKYVDSLESSEFNLNSSYSYIQILEQVMGYMFTTVFKDIDNYLKITEDIGVASEFVRGERLKEDLDRILNHNLNYSKEDYGINRFANNNLCVDVLQDGRFNVIVNGQLDYSF